MSALPAATAPARPVAPPPITSDDFDLALATRLTPEKDAGPELKRVLRAVWTWIRNDVKKALLIGLIGAAIAYVANVVIVAVHYNGFGRVPSGGAAVAPGHEITGGVFWALAMAVVFGLISYRISAGREAFWEGVRGAPAVPRRLFTADGRPALEHLLWGFAGTMLVASLLGPAISGMLAIGLALLIISVVRVILTDVVMLVWQRVLRAIAPNRRRPPGNSALSVGMIGSVLALVGAFVFSDATTKLIIAVVAGALAFVISRRVIPAQAAMLLLVGVAAPAMIALLSVHGVQASDGGWQECGSDFSAWLRCGGQGVLSNSWLAGLFGLAGTGAGTGIGPALTAEQRRQQALKKEMARWRQDHPCESWDGFWQGHTETDQGNLLNDMADSISADYASGEMQARLTAMFRNAPAGAWHGLQGLVGQMYQMTQDMGTYGPMLGPMKYGYDQMQALIQAMPTLPDKLNQLQAAMASHDPETSGKIFGELMGQAEFMGVLGRLQGAAMKGMMPQEPVFPGSTPGQAALRYAADGTPVAADDLMPVGWRGDQIRAGAQVAQQYDGTLVLKPGQQAAAEAQLGNPLAKPEYLAPKSAEPLDATIGMGGPGRDGFVQYRLPDPPQPPPGLSGENLASWEQAANSQYAKRMSQYFDNQQSMNNVFKNGATFKINGQDVHLGVSAAGEGSWTNPITGGTQKFADGVITAVVPEDAPPWVQQTLGPPGTKVPVPGDSDAFTFVSNARRAADGSIRPLSSFPPDQAAAIQAQEAAAQQAMQKGGIPGVVHEGDTPNWTPPTPAKAAVKQCIMHASSADNPTGENLVWISSKGDVTVGRWPGFSDAPPGYDAPAPGGGYPAAPPGYDAPVPNTAPPGYDTPPGTGGSQ